jgi:uncharacterized protein (DUF1330 family)
MPAYVIVLRESPVKDPEQYAEYQSMTRKHPRDPNLIPRVINGAIEGLEGTAPDGAIVLEFPTMDDARAWYNSPGYQEALPHRLKSAEYRTFIVEGM